MNRLTLEIVSETTVTTPIEVVVCDESESETRMTPEKLKSRDGLFEWPDHGEYARGSSDLITTATTFITDNDSTLNIRPIPRVKKPEEDW